MQNTYKQAGASQHPLKKHSDTRILFANFPADRQFNPQAFMTDHDPVTNSMGKYPVWFQQLMKPAANQHLHTWYAENIYPEPEE
ncbi:MAG: hypothetical protein IPH68_15445 [Chitinophagaceae bacterium]|nr:hypothetical protein [Chitinophagaceae bacterium]MBK7124049.1 hypothetical protein [Chitinophagaceae bacterium]